MRHNHDRRKLNRTASHRRAMLRNMVTSLFARERISTTTAKAKETRRLAERMITFARRGDLAARRHVARTVNDPGVLQKLFDEIGPRYADRPGGYTRILKLGIRRGDAAETAILELIGEDDEGRKKKKKSRKKHHKVEVPASPVRAAAPEAAGVGEAADVGEAAEEDAAAGAVEDAAAAVEAGAVEDEVVEKEAEEEAKAGEAAGEKGPEAVEAPEEKKAAGGDQDEGKSGSKDEAGKKEDKKK